jgi:hypothetical protein
VASRSSTPAHARQAGRALAFALIVGAIVALAAWLAAAATRRDRRAGRKPRATQAIRERIRPAQSTAARTFGDEPARRGRRDGDPQFSRMPSPSLARPLWIVTSMELARIRSPTADAFSTPPLRCSAGAPPFDSLCGESLFSLPGQAQPLSPRSQGPRPRALLAPFTAAICDVRLTCAP